MYKLIYLLFLTLCTIGDNTFGQLLDNSQGNALSDRPFFNEDLIRENKIKSISGDFTVKKVGDILRDTELGRTYFFNRKGQLVKSLETTQASIGLDTLVSYFEYNEAGDITAIRTKDHYGFYATIYKYDSLGRVIREEFRRNLNKNNSSFDLEIGKEFVVTYETSSYQEFDGQQKRTVYNSYGTPYKDVFTYYDEDGLITQKVERLQRTSGTKSTNYSYNEKGLLDTIKVVSSQSGIKKREYVFSYDEWNNLIKKEYYKNGEYITEERVLYDEETMMINYIMTQEVSTGYIMVLELSKYEFYD
ncbi:MAG: hypothetical protein COA32_13965 [Fluviicola sp.]|nr:MAG: hypothetical protein COA32_13965 [Fluviicola sp.]